MALPDYIKNELGTAITWASSGGTYAITLTSLSGTAGTARQGAKGDLGADRAQIYDVLFTSSVGSAVTAPNQELELWWAASDNATAESNNPLGPTTSNTVVTGADAAFGSASTNSERTAQLLFIGSLNFSNAVGTAVQAAWLSFVPPSRYGMPIVVNRTGQALGSTAGDHLIRLVPRETAVVDTV